MENDGLFHLIGDVPNTAPGAKVYHFLGTPDMRDGFLNLRERPRQP